MFGVVVGGSQSRGCKISPIDRAAAGKRDGWRTSRSVGDVEAYGGMMRTVMDITSVSAVFTASRFLSLPMVDALMRRKPLLVSKCRSMSGPFTFPRDDPDKETKGPQKAMHARTRIDVGTRTGRPRR